MKLSPIHMLASFSFCFGLHLYATNEWMDFASCAQSSHLISSDFSSSKVQKVTSSANSFLQDIPSAMQTYCPLSQTAQDQKNITIKKEENLLRRSGEPINGTTKQFLVTSLIIQASGQTKQ